MAKLGDERTIEKFVHFPVKIKGTWHWWQDMVVHQRFSIVLVHMSEYHTWEDVEYELKDNSIQFQKGKGV